MILLFGTVPDKNLPLTYGQVRQEGDNLVADGRRFSRTQGTGAMISAALAITNYFKIESPYVLVAGDIGDGKGTRDLYKYLTDHIVEMKPEVLTMHYSLPIMALLKKLFLSRPTIKCEQPKFWRNTAWNRASRGPA